MLKQKDAVGTLAVKDLAVAKAFYGGALGLELVSANEPEALTYASGGSTIIVYRSQFAGTNKATALNWRVGDEVEEVARTLKGRGVTFEHYDFPGMTMKGDVHVMEGMKAAWFKDPDGNILCIMSG